MARLGKGRTLFFLGGGGGQVRVRVRVRAERTEVVARLRKGRTLFFLGGGRGAGLGSGSAGARYVSTMPT